MSLSLFYAFVKFVTMATMLEQRRDNSEKAQPLYNLIPHSSVETA